MTLDGRPPIEEHRGLRRHDAEAEAEWLRVARLQEQEDRDRYRRELEDRDATESVEATEALWAGIFAQQPSWIRDTIYARDRG